MKSQIKEKKQQLMKNGLFLDILNIKKKEETEKKMCRRINKSVKDRIFLNLQKLQPLL